MREKTQALVYFFIAAVLLVCGVLFTAACSGGNGGAPVIENLIVLGSTESDEIAIKKYDSTGIEDTEHWNKVLTGITGRATTVSIDEDNNVYICYFSGSTITAVKYDADGNKDAADWDFNIDYNPTSFVESTVDRNNNVYICGYSGSGNNNRRWWVKKYSSDGVEDTSGFWDDLFDLGYGYSLCHAVACDQDNAIYVAGRSMDTESGDDNNDKWLIKKFNANGTEITGNWPYLGLEGIYHQVDALAFDSGRNIYAVGNDGDWRIKKFSADGIEDAEWNKSESTGSSGGSISVAVDSDDRVYVLGYDNSGADQDMLLKCYTPDGSEDLAWNKTMDSGGPDRPHQVLVDRNKNVYVTGHDKDNYVWLRKYNSNGTVDWEKTTDLKCPCGNISIQNMALFH